MASWEATICSALTSLCSKRLFCCRCSMMTPTGTAPLTIGTVGSVLWGALLGMALYAVLGISVGALIRSQVAAIVIVLAFTQFIEPILRVAGGFVDWLNEVTRFLPGAASDALAGRSFYSSLGGPAAVDTGALEWWQGGLVLLAFAIVFTLLGQLFSWRRDVT